MPETATTPLVRVDEEFSCRLRYSDDQIVAFARLTGDANPLHHDRLAAQRAQFGAIIASGQQTASHMMGLVASHFSRHDDGVPREMLCLNFNFAFKAPVFAEQDIGVAWRVSRVEASARQGGYIGQLDGHARVGARICVVGRGTVLVKRAAGRPG